MTCSHIARTLGLVCLLTACGGSSGDGEAASADGGSGANGAATNGTAGTNGGNGSGASTTGNGGSNGESSGGTSGGSTGTGGAMGTFVAGDLPDYQWDQLPADKVPWQHLSVLNLGMLWPMASGQTYTLGQNNWETRVPDPISDSWSNSAKAYAAAAHANGKKLVCLLGGAGGNPNPSGQSGKDAFTLATDTAAHAEAFAKNIKSVLQAMQFDGVNLDWEDGSKDAATMHAGLVRLAHAIRSVWPEALITIPAGPMGDDATGLAPAKEDVDAFEPMTYLNAPQWGGWVLPCPLTPLHAAHDNPYSIDQTLAKWKDAGVPTSKILLGTGGYGAVWGDSNDDHQAPNAPFANASSPNSNPNGEYGALCDDNCVTQAWLDRTLAAHTDLKEGWDDATKSSYWAAPAANKLVRVEDPRNAQNTVEVGLIFYETPKSIREKASYVQQKQMKGISFWTVAELVNGTSAPVLEAIP